MSKQAGFFAIACAGVFLVGLVAVPLMGQPAEGGRRGDRGEGGFDREAMQQRMAEMMRQRLGASEEEWQVLAPRVQKVMTLRQQAAVRGGFGGFGGRRGGPGGPGRGDAQRDPADMPPVAAATENLRTLLEDESAEPADIKAALQALRDARSKAEQELAEAQTQLREVLSLRQEAALVTMGLLD
jgi:Spy/CpxP family protein refolding chaperone